MFCSSLRVYPPDELIPAACFSGRMKRELSDRALKECSAEMRRRLAVRLSRSWRNRFPGDAISELDYFSWVRVICVILITIRDSAIGLQRKTRPLE